MINRGASILRSEVAGGVILIVAAALALILANAGSGTGRFYAAMVHLATGPILSPRLGPMTVELWINDGLMALFFLGVGLEIKRELVGGELSRPDQRLLPVAAALSGMAVPAIVYLAATGAAPALVRGWAIPAATDIAFAVGILALLGSRVPASLKLLLLTIAIVDDLGAVAIIALVYAGHLQLVALGGAAIILAILCLMNRRGVTAPLPYLLGFGLLWYAVLLSGVHATVAGVLAAMTIPVRTVHADSTLHRIEHALVPWVVGLVLPLFALANAGVSLGGGAGALTAPLSLGIAAGLFLGKQVGIFGSIWLCVRAGWAAKPAGAGWQQIYGMALLCGIGFTMSLFIAGLAFPGQAAVIAEAKIGILGGSLVSAVAGFAVLRLAGRRRDR